MRSGIVTSVLVATSICIPSTAVAQSGRYTIEKSEDGYVRMDTTTGEMSFCRTEGDQIVCKLSADDRAALNEHIAELEARIAALEHRLAAGNPDPAPAPELPSEQDLEKTLGFMEKFFRRFMDIVKDLEKETGKGEPEVQEPEKT